MDAGRETRIAFVASEEVAEEATFCATTSLPVMLAQTLPEELLELIFGFMHDDKVSLSHCSHVCRTWLPLSSRLLFRELQPRLGSPDATMLDWCADFLNELKACGRAQSCIRHLVLSSEHLDGQPACQASSLREILLALPNLKSFSLAYLDVIYDTPSSSFSSDIPGDKLSLDTITLCNVLSLSTYRGQVVESGVSESTGLAEFLSLFGRIGALHIDNSALPYLWPFTWYLLDAKPVPLPRLTLLWVEELLLTGFQGAKMLGALEGTVDPRSLRMLAVELSPEVLALVDAFLRRMTELRSVRFVMRADLPSRGALSDSSVMLWYSPASLCFRTGRSAGSACMLYATVNTNIPALISPLDQGSAP